MESSKQKPLNNFLPDVRFPGLLGLNSGTFYEKQNCSPNPVDMFSVDTFL